MANYTFIKPRSLVPVGDTKTFLSGATRRTWKLEKDGLISICTKIVNFSGSTATITINKDKTNTLDIDDANTPFCIHGLIEEIECNQTGVTFVCETLKISDMVKEEIIKA